MASNQLVPILIDVLVDAPAAAVWAAVVDWDRQSEWMLGTTVRSTINGGVGVGGKEGTGCFVEA